MNLTKAVLHQLIDNLPDEIKSKDPSFGIYQFGGGPDESRIEANMPGLLLFVGQLLQAIIDDATIEPGSARHATLDVDAEWINKDCDIYISTIDFIEEKPALKKPAVTKKPLTDWILPAGCIIFAIILVAATFIGLWTIGKWILTR